MAKHPMVPTRDPRHPMFPHPTHGPQGAIPAGRDVEKFRNRRRLKITIEGLMGAGKTTVAQAIANELRKAGCDKVTITDGEAPDLPSHPELASLDAGFYRSIEIVVKNTPDPDDGSD